VSEQLLEGMKGILELAGKGATDLMDEALNLFVVLSILDILKFASVFVIFYIVKKYLDTIMAATESEKTKRLAHSAKVAGLILSIIFFVSHSYDGAVSITKALVAPKIFLLEKGYGVAKEIKKAE
jgi:hypothetical protein